MGKAEAGFRESLRADLAPQIGTVIEVGGKAVEFILDAGRDAGQQDREQTNEGKLAVTKKGVGFEANRGEQFRGMKVRGEGAQNAQEFKIPLLFILIES